MRIAFLVRVFPSLSETFILNQITSLIDRGHEVDVFAAVAQEGVHHREVEEYSLIDRTDYARPLPSGRLGRAVRVGSTILQSSVHAVGVARAVVEGHRRGGGFTAAAVVQAADQHRRAQRDYDILHSHFGRAGLVTSLLRRAGLVDAPHVVSFYGHDVSRFPLIHGRHCYAPLFAHSERILALGDSMRRRLIELGAPESRTRVHRLGVDPGRFRAGPRATAPDEPVKLLSVGRLVEKKGLEDAIEAIALLRAGGNRVRYRIVGGGPLDERLRELVLERGLGDSVEFLGPLPRLEVARQMADADIFVLPSVTAADGDEEGTPTVILEAMASGLPVVATRHSGIPEQVFDGRTGFLVPERRPAELAERLVLLTTDADLRRAMGAAGRIEVERDFESSTLAGKLESLYREALELAPARSPGGRSAH